MVSSLCKGIGGIDFFNIFTPGNTHNKHGAAHLRNRRLCLSRGKRPENGKGGSTTCPNAIKNDAGRGLIPLQRHRRHRFLKFFTPGNPPNKHGAAHLRTRRLCLSRGMRPENVKGGSTPCPNAIKKNGGRGLIPL